VWFASFWRYYTELETIMDLLPRNTVITFTTCGLVDLRVGEHLEETMRRLKAVGARPAPRSERLLREFIQRTTYRTRIEETGGPVGLWESEQERYLRVFVSAGSERQEPVFFAVCGSVQCAGPLLAAVPRLFSVRTRRPAKLGGELVWALAWKDGDPTGSTYYPVAWPWEDHTPVGWSSRRDRYHMT